MHLFIWFSLLVKVTFAVDLGKDCQCSVAGDPHYRTFDGQHITFAGHCKYALVTPKGWSHLDDFKVEVKNKKRGNVKIPYTDRVLITLGKHLIQLKQHSRVMIDGKHTRLPFIKPDFNVTIDRQKVMRLTVEDGVIITFDGHQRSHVTLPICYAGRVGGLCGNCNGLKDDFRLENGSDVTNHSDKFDLIGESYRIPDKFDSDPSCRKAIPTNRLKRETRSISPYEGLRHICANISSNRHLAFKAAPDNSTVQIDHLREACKLMEDFERTKCKGSGSVHLTCDTPNVREPRYAKHKEDFYSVNGVHFIRIAKAIFYESLVLSVQVTPDLSTCLLGCLRVSQNCLGVVYIMGMTCVHYEKQVGVSEVVPGPFQDVFLRVPDVFDDIFRVRGVSKKFSPEMELHVSLDRCKSICRECSKCEGIQYQQWKRICIIFMGIGQNGYLRAVEGGWSYFGFLNRICSKKCVEHARCLVSKTSSYCKCEKGYVGDGIKICKKV